MASQVPPSKTEIEIAPPLLHHTLLRNYTCCNEVAQLSEARVLALRAVPPLRLFSLLDLRRTRPYTSQASQEKSRTASHQAQKPGRLESLRAEPPGCAPPAARQLLGQTPIVLPRKVPVLVIQDCQGAKDRPDQVLHQPPGKGRSLLEGSQAAEMRSPVSRNRAISKGNSRNQEAICAGSKVPHPQPRQRAGV